MNMNNNVNISVKKLIVSFIVTALLSGSISGTFAGFTFNKSEPVRVSEKIVYDCSGVTGERFGKMIRSFDSCVDKTAMWQTCRQTAVKFYCKPIKKSNM